MNMDDSAPVREIHGITLLFSETGTEGGWWAVMEDGLKGYAALHYLEEGDDFTVYAGDGSVLWHGMIRKDEKTSRRCHRVLRDGKWVADRGRMQQVAGGFWVHWLQAGMPPEEWGKLFRGEKRCVLIHRKGAEDLDPQMGLAREIMKENSDALRKLTK